MGNLQTMHQENDFITTTEACDLLQVSKTIIKKMADTGELETWKTPGGHRRISRASLEATLAKKTDSTSRYMPPASLRVMVMDDDRVIQELFKGISQNKAFPAVDIVSAFNGYEGLMNAGQGKFDMIFVDINMPLMNGYEAVNALKNNENTKETTIIIITGAKINRELRSKLPSDAVVMPKPLNWDVIKKFMQYEHKIKNPTSR